LITCTKLHPKEDFPSRNIAFWEKVKDAPDFSSPEITAAFKHMRSLGAEAGIDGALDAAKADAFILPSVICSDIPGPAGYPTITVPMGYLPNDSPITKNPRGNLVDKGPNVP
jgi:amidase